MAQQVSGSDKTLLEAIRDGDVPEPALMRWNAWQTWRSTAAGRLPTMSVDGYSVSRAQESALWKSVMLELYGTEWSMQLDSIDDPYVYPAISAQIASPSPLGEPSYEPAAGADRVTQSSVLRSCVPNLVLAANARLFSK